MLSPLDVLATDGCGVTKGCYRIPNRCQLKDCMFFVSWHNTSDGVAFQYVAKVEDEDDIPWAGFGLNTERKMVNLCEFVIVIFLFVKLCGFV